MLSKALSLQLDMNRAQKKLKAKATQMRKKNEVNKFYNQIF